MHVTTKEVDNNGVHILTSVIEGDGAVALASEKADLKAEVISIQRTASGGVQVQVAVKITEPAPEVAPAEVTPQDEAIAYFVRLGFTKETAAKQVERFGVARILAQAAKEKSEADKALDDELSQLVSNTGQKA